MPAGAIGKLRKGINPAIPMPTPRATGTGEGPANLIRTGRTRTGIGSNNLIRERPKGKR